MNVCIKYNKLVTKLVDVPILPFQVKKNRTFDELKLFFKMVEQLIIHLY